MKPFEQNIINLYGDEGKQWLVDLPEMIMKLQAVYKLTGLKPVKNLSYHYVLSGFQDAQPIVVKLGLDVDELKREASILTAFSGFGAVHVLAENNGLLLLEGAAPGISLKSYFPEKDEEAINITANILKHLHKAPIPHAHILHVKDWLAALDQDWKIPAAYLKKARRLCDHLLRTSGKEVLLHGDLHQDNILKNGNDWVVIDPKGVLGEPAYEVAAFIRNPIPELLANDNARSIIHRRITRFAELLELSEHRIIDWCFVQAVLSWSWAKEDGHDDSYFRDLTDFFKNPY